MATPSGNLNDAPLPAVPGLMVPNWNGNTVGVQLTRRTNTTARGFAAASLCLGLWGSLTFWIYPFGLLVSVVAVSIGLVSIALGIRAGNEGQHLAWTGVLFGSIGAGAAITIYRFYQLAFEGALPNWASVLWGG